MSRLMYSHDGGTYFYLLTPLTTKEIKAFVEGPGMEGWITTVVNINFAMSVENDWEWFWDKVSETVTSSPTGFMDMEYELIGATPSDVILKVSGQLNAEELLRSEYEK